MFFITDPIRNHIIKYYQFFLFFSRWLFNNIENTFSILLLDIFEMNLDQHVAACWIEVDIWIRKNP